MEDIEERIYNRLPPMDEHESAVAKHLIANFVVKTMKTPKGGAASSTTSNTIADTVVSSQD